MADREELDGGSIRASDRDRNRAAEELRIHCAEGRITVEELERRLEQVMAAETIHQVASAVYDLPQVRTARAATQGPRKVRVGPPGIRPFTQRIVVPTSAERTRVIALDTIAPGLNGMGYELRQQSATELRFERSRKERIVIALEATGPGDTLMIVHGRAPRSVRKTFARLSFS